MKKTYLLIFVILAVLVSLFIAGCNSGLDVIPTLDPEITPAPTEIPVNAEGTTIKDRFVPPDGYKRIDAPKGSFGEYLQNFALKPMGEPAYTFEDKESEAAGAAIAVFDQDVTKFQQCADSIMRLYAEYLYEKGDYDKIAFTFTKGFVCDFSTWSQGNRVKLTGNTFSWVKKAEPNTDKATLDKYLDYVYQRSNTASLQTQMNPVAVDDIQIGDCFVITAEQMSESLGHAVFIADMCENDKGERLYLIFEGTTPATQITLAKDNDTTYGYWIPLAEDGTLSITKTVLDEETQQYEDKTWVCPGEYIRRF